jgi:DNA-binding LacI/PurR family transcriptional regulator
MTSASRQPASVRQPREQLGRTAAQLLAEEVNDREHHIHRQVVYEPELVVRTSSAARRDPAGDLPLPHTATRDDQPVV